ncbi:MULTISPECIES: prephenate dehydrogenase [Bacillus]|uniref:prephenate dehydrogenase n=1 Tax=Bacillus TaxID=1386 RepID=UPI0002F32DD7|nr:MULTISPECIES: prephenate dehydrogenase [Bacillus]
MRGNVFVIGLGLIGGSVALAIKNTHPDTIISGFDINDSSLQLSKALGIIDKTCESIQECAENADLIIIGTPVKQTEELLSQLATFHLKENTIVTDVGSTKTKITKAAAKLMERGVTFIGGHPMAGSHKTGPAAAKTHLFENAFYLLTPTEQVEEKQIAMLKAWLRGTKAHFLVVTPEEHDQLTGVISHFPHIIAAGLVQSAYKSNLENNLVTRLAAGGFRDVTRIASSSPEMWRDILLHNREVLLSLMNEWIKEMEEVKSYIYNNDSQHIFDFFSKAKEFRDELPIRSQGAIPAFYDLYVDVPDYPGVIAEVVGYLAEERISLTNIRILETREELYGVLVISFQSEGDRKLAEECLEKKTNFGVYIM